MVNEASLQEIRVFLDRVLGQVDIPSSELLFRADLIVAGVATRLMAKAASGALSFQDLYSQGGKGPNGPHHLDLLVRYLGDAFGNTKETIELP